MHFNTMNLGVKSDKGRSTLVDNYLKGLRGLGQNVCYMYQVHSLL